MSKTKRINKRRHALISLLAKGEDLDSILKKLRITPRRAMQMLTSRDALADWLTHTSVLSLQEALIYRSSVAAASLVLRQHLTDDKASPELRVKAANAILAQPAKLTPSPKTARAQNPPQEEDDQDDWSHPLQ